MKLILSFTAFSYLLSLRKPVREEVRQILGGADEAGVSADGRLAFAVLKEMGAVQFESTAASNIAASNSVANNQCVKAEVAESSSAAASPQDPQQADNAAAPHPQVEPHKASHVATASAYPDGHNNEAAEVAEVAAEVEKEAVTNVCDTAVRCRARGQVWLDMECMEQDELRELMPALKPAQLEEMLPRDEFRRGCTLNGVQAELLKPEVLNVEPPTCSDVPVRYFHMMNAVRRLIDSRRCLLFEQVRALLNSDFTTECYNAVIDAFASESEREDFLSMSRTERLHAVAQLWIINVKVMRKLHKQQHAA